MSPDLDSAGVYYMTREDFESRTPEPDSAAKPQATCKACSSRYYSEQSEMPSLCPECAHRLHGTPPCDHRFVDGRCQLCDWDGSLPNSPTIR